MIYYTKKRQYGTSFSKCIPRIVLENMLEKDKIYVLLGIKKHLTNNVKTLSVRVNDWLPKLDSNEA